MENTALNGTATTEDQEDWKKKKGYGPILVVAVSLALLLGLALYKGGPVNGGTPRPPPLPRDDVKDRPNVAASSSSLSLVGSGTAASASDMKTLTIAVDDDETIDVLLSDWQRLGGSAALCTKNTGYNCGAVFPLNGNTCGQSGCCCRQEDGTGYKMNTCDGATGYAYRGCNSCLGETACFETKNVNIGDSSCHGEDSCNSVSDSTIYNESCHTHEACISMENSTIHDGSCQGFHSCNDVMSSTIHAGSCKAIGSCGLVKNSIIGKGSCTGDGNVLWPGGSCGGSENITIGHNSCNMDPNYRVSVCMNCAHNVPDNACNQGITADMTNGYCNFCVTDQGVVSSSTSMNKKSKANKKQAVGPPKKK